MKKIFRYTIFLIFSIITAQISTDYIQILAKDIDVSAKSAILICRQNIQRGFSYDNLGRTMGNTILVTAYGTAVKCEEYENRKEK